MVRVERPVLATAPHLATRSHLHHTRSRTIRPDTIPTVNSHSCCRPYLHWRRLATLPTWRHVVDVDGFALRRFRILAAAAGQDVRDAANRPRHIPLDRSEHM